MFTIASPSPFLSGCVSYNLRVLPFISALGYWPIGQLCTSLYYLILFGWDLCMLLTFPRGRWTALGQARNITVQREGKTILMEEKGGETKFDARLVSDLA